MPNSPPNSLDLKEAVARDRWSNGGPAEEKARNTAFPNAAMFSQTIAIFHGDVMPNWPRPPVQERSVGTSEDSMSWGRIRHYAAQITRVASSAIARSCDSGIPCLSSAGPPLLQRSARTSRWKAQQRYRTTAPGQQKRNGQSRRYRGRVKSRKPAEPEAVNDPARVITKEHFFRPFLRPTGLLREIRAGAAKSLTSFLLTRLPARAGARRRTGTALETGANLIRRY
jgi:hypothetical protein